MNGDIRVILTDIEGTTTPVSFVYDVLFPYARARISAYVRDHRKDLTVLLAEVRQAGQGADLTVDECIDLLLRWMDEDRKIAPLKTVQGMIWREGYETGRYAGQMFPDVAPALRSWTQRGCRVCIYSSGSVDAQELLFRHSDAGDLTPFISGYFDTRIGDKKEAVSYSRIAREIGVAPSSVLFLSDHPDELDAAARAGMTALGLCRPGNLFPLEDRAAVNGFDEIDLTVLPSAIR
ncbi:acireductone synthase [Iodidimonas sp. SYSU 1G8]|uniref:acireductone synthase n=1 Tax=Iodidimonas sp. SYSU 1G8 TaxID=3133967 RepID=UPI0031FF2520